MCTLCSISMIIIIIIKRSCLCRLPGWSPCCTITGITAGPHTSHCPVRSFAVSAAAAAAAAAALSKLSTDVDLRPASYQSDSLPHAGRGGGGLPRYRHYFSSVQKYSALNTTCRISTYSGRTERTAIKHSTSSDAFEPSDDSVFAYLLTDSQL